jgi:hypothetical protein
MIAKTKIGAILALALFGVMVGLAWVPAANPGASAKPPSFQPVAAQFTAVTNIAINQTQYNYNSYNETGLLGAVVSMYYGAPGAIIAQYKNLSSGLGIDPYSDPVYVAYHVDPTLFNVTLNLTALGVPLTQTTGLPLIYTGTPGDGVGNYTFPLPYVLPIGVYTACVNFSNPYIGAEPAGRPFIIAVLPCPDAITLNSVTQNGTTLSPSQGCYNTTDSSDSIIANFTVTNGINGTVLSAEPVLTNSNAGNVSLTDANGACSINLNPANLAANTSIEVMVSVSDADYTGNLTLTVYVTSYPPPPPYDWTFWEILIPVMVIIAIIAIWLVARDNSWRVKIVRTTLDIATNFETKSADDLLWEIFSDNIEQFPDFRKRVVKWARSTQGNAKRRQQVQR